MNGTDIVAVKRIPDGELAPTGAGPRELYRQATDVAGVCGEIVRKTSKRIGNRDHVAVEGWQAIATTHGCMLSVEEVTEDPDGNVTSIASVRRMSDGAVLSRAEGFVGMDEKMWAGRARYARRAMAQTRAMSRVARAAFAHVVILIDAGLSTTPAEEMGGDYEPEDHRPRQRQPQHDPFVDRWVKGCADRGFTEDRAGAFLAHFLESKGLTLATLDRPARERLMNMLEAGSYDSWLRPPAKEPGRAASHAAPPESAPGASAAGDQPDPPAEPEADLPPDMDTPPVDVVTEALDRPVGEYTPVLVDALVESGVGKAQAVKAITGWQALNTPKGSDGPTLEKRRELFAAIKSGTAKVTNTGVLRFEK